MRLAWFIARRYLFSRSLNNAIHLITLVSMVGIAVGTAALLIVLSVFNGLTTFIEGLFAAVDPHVKIVAARGQYFERNTDAEAYLSSHPDVAAWTGTLRGTIGLQYLDHQAFADIVGVEDNFTRVNALDTFVYEGSYNLRTRGGVHQVLLGSMVAANLNADLADQNTPIIAGYIPQESNLVSLENAFSSGRLLPSGYFSVQKEYDEKLAFAHIDFVRELLGIETAYSAYEVRLKDINQAAAFKKEVLARLGPEFQALTWYEQHETLYKVMRNEKYVSFLIVVLMLAIAAVNIVGSLSMVVLEKKRDISILKSCGSNWQLIRQVFLIEGLLVTGIGVLSGMTFAWIFGLLQQRYGLIRVNGGETFRVDAFPLEMQAGDFALVFVTVIALGTLAAWYPAQKGAKAAISEGLRE